MSEFNLNIKILVVDDFPTMRRIVKTILKQVGFENIDDAEDGMVAFNKLNKTKYDLVVSDWNMPNMEGIDLVRKIRKDSQLKDIAFLMVTAEAEKEKVIEAIKAGVDNYIVKPFNMVVLKEKLMKLAQKRPIIAKGEKI